MKKLKLVFMGTPTFTLPSLKLIYNSIHHLGAVVTRPDKPGGRGQKIRLVPAGHWAEEHGVEVARPARMKDRSFLAWLEEKAPDLIVTVAFGRILPPEILNLPPLGCINLHASYLPAYRGAAPIHRAVMEGAPFSGVSVIKLVSELDAGNIIVQEKEPISVFDTTGMLHDRLSERGAALLLKAINVLAEGTAVFTPQDESRATYAHPLQPGEERLDWTLGPLELYNRIRGLNPIPGAFTTFEGKRIKVWRAARPEEGESDRNKLQAVNELPSPGTVLSVGRDSLSVSTGGGGVLNLLELQPAGKKQMDAGAFCCGYRIEPGLRLDGDIDC